jgi:ATP-dependent exoDNAse (exonuclease V) beta subunit
MKDQIAPLKPKFSVELIVEKRKHFYKANSDLLPGVTGFLQIINKPGISIWSKREALASVERALMTHIREPKTEIILTEAWIKEILTEAQARPEKIKDDAADLGTLVHKYIDQVIQGKMPTDLTPEMEPAVTAFIEWWKNSKIELVMGDTKVASLIHGYGGSLDALGRQNGQYVILDWKTSNGIYDEYALQVSAYWQAFTETYGESCARGYIVRFGKKLPVTFEVREIANMEESFKAFLAAKNLTHSMGMKHFL